jgi:hypothetical protein
MSTSKIILKVERVTVQYPIASESFYCLDRGPLLGATEAKEQIAAFFGCDLGDAALVLMSTWSEPSTYVAPFLGDRPQGF